MSSVSAERLAHLLANPDHISPRYELPAIITLALESLSLRPALDIDAEASHIQRSALCTQGEGGLTAYELQVLIGTTISGCNMAPDQTFDLKAAWSKLYTAGLIDRTDGLAIATSKGAALVASALASSPQPVAEAVADGGDVAARAITLVRKFINLMDDDVFDELAADTVHIEAHEYLTSLESRLGAGRTQGGEAAEWAIKKWHDEVLHRPLQNIHRRTLDDTWRQVIRHFGQDPDSVLPLADHDTLAATSPQPEGLGVEVTDEMVERAAKVIDPNLWPLLADQEQRTGEPIAVIAARSGRWAAAKETARAALTAALAEKE